MYNSSIIQKVNTSYHFNLINKVYKEGSQITNIKSEQTSITLTNKERLSLIEDMLNTKEHSNRVQGLFLGFTLAFLSFIFFCAYILFSALFPGLAYLILLLGLFFNLVTLMFFTTSKHDPQNTVFKGASSDIDKINAFIYYTNSKICGKKIINGELAIPLISLGNQYTRTKWVIQPLLSIDNIDIFLTNDCANLVLYRIPISPLEYFELEKLLKSNVEEFNKEIIRRGYYIKLHD